MDNSDIKMELEIVKNRIKKIQSILSKLNNVSDNISLSKIDELLSDENKNQSIKYFGSLKELIDALKIELERNNERMKQLIQEMERRNKEEQKALREVIASQNDYSTKSNEELELEYRQIRAQIKRIARKIWSICDHEDISTYYKFNDVGEIILEKAADESESSMLFEMNQIMQELEIKLSTIEEYYTGTNLKEMPILDDAFFDDGKKFDEYDQNEKIINEVFYPRKGI